MGKHIDTSRLPADEHVTQIYGEPTPIDDERPFLRSLGPLAMIAAGALILLALVGCRQ